MTTVVGVFKELSERPAAAQLLSTLDQIDTWEERVSGTKHGSTFGARLCYGRSGDRRAPWSTRSERRGTRFVSWAVGLKAAWSLDRCSLRDSSTTTRACSTLTSCASDSSMWL